MGRPLRPIGSRGEIWFAARKNASGPVVIAGCTVRDPDGRTRQVQRSGRSERDARRRLLAHLDERVGGSSAGELTGATRLDQAVALWREEIAREVAGANMSAATLQTYDVAMNHVLPRIGQLTLAELTVYRLQQLMNGLAGELAPPSLRGIRTALGGVLSFAARNGAIPTSPMHDVRPVAVKRKQVRALTEDEEASLLRRVDEDKRAVRQGFPDLLRVMLATGVRIGEALALPWEEVDLGDVDRPCSVLITGTVIRVKGVGVVRKDTKSAAGRREIELPSWGQDVLTNRFIAVFGRLDPLDGMFGPVFPSVAGGWRDPSNLLNRWDEVRKRVGFEWVNLHQLRKTMATRLDDAGVPARAVSDRLGHSKVSMTQDNYLGRGGELGRHQTAAALERRGA